MLRYDTGEPESIKEIPLLPKNSVAGCALTRHPCPTVSICTYLCPSVVNNSPREHPRRKWNHPGISLPQLAHFRFFWGEIKNNRLSSKISLALTRQPLYDKDGPAPVHDKSGCQADS
jgi:hypothetical protein